MPYYEFPKLNNDMIDFTTNTVLVFSSRNYGYIDKSKSVKNQDPIAYLRMKITELTNLKNANAIAGLYNLLGKLSLCFYIVHSKTLSKDYIDNIYKAIENRGGTTPEEIETEKFLFKSIIEDKGRWVDFLFEFKSNTSYKDVYNQCKVKELVKEPEIKKILDILDNMLPARFFKEEYKNKHDKKQIELIEGVNSSTISQRNLGFLGAASCALGGSLGLVGVAVGAILAAAGMINPFIGLGVAIAGAAIVASALSFMVWRCWKKNNQTSLRISSQGLLSANNSNKILPSSNSLDNQVAIGLPSSSKNR